MPISNRNENPFHAGLLEIGVIECEPAGTHAELRQIPPQAMTQERMTNMLLVRPTDIQSSGIGGWAAPAGARLLPLRP